MLVKEAKVITGGGIVNGNGKMPGSTYATDPFRCNTGSKLRKVAGTSCSKCYSCKLASFRPSVAKGYSNRHEAMLEASKDAMVGLKWVQAMVFMIKRSGDTHFRWFDGGDIVSPKAFDLIAQVAFHTPEVQHWLPTKEYKWFKEWIAQGGVVPKNLVVRVSTPKIDTKVTLKTTHTSTVSHKEAHIGHLCPANGQGGTCGDCRACWDKEVANVSYPLH